MSILSSVAVGCASDPAAIPTDTDTSGSGSTTSSTSSGGPVVDKAEELFRGLENDLLAGCGTCHSSGDTNFLAGEDPYESIVAWRGIVIKDWRKSKLLTIPVQNGGHEGGKNLDSTTVAEGLLSRVEAWLEAEAEAIVKPEPTDGGPVTGPSIEPVTPVMGFNALYLDSLGAEFQGMAITFFADAPTPGLLMLYNVEIHATSDKGLHIVHPLFVVYPKGVEADPDPVDSCSNIDQTVDVGGTAELGPGTVVLTNWQEEAKIAVVFEKVEPYLPGGPVVDDGCKNVDAFIANAAGPLQNNCAGACHGGTNGQAKAAVDMSALQDDPAKACGQVLNRVKLDAPNDSQIFVVTIPNNNTPHPFKFMNGNFENFRTAVSTWITAEAEADAAGQ